MRSHIHQHRHYGTHDQGEHLGAWFWGTLLAVMLTIASAARGLGEILA